MPTPKTKPATVESTTPIPPQTVATPITGPRDYLKDYDANASLWKERAQFLSDFLGDLSSDEMELMSTVRLIWSRERGCNSPVETFIYDLLILYMTLEKKGKGVTLEQIESKMETLREDYQDALGMGHSIADRYPRPASDASA